jgi:hypothetical protein
VGTIIDAILFLINEIFFFSYYFPKLSKTSIFSNKKEAIT